MSEADLRILMVEDQEADAILIQRELRRQGLTLTVRRVEHDDAFIRALREFAPDLVLSDYALPGFSGLEALAILRKERPEVPLIIVSGIVGEEQAVEILKLGATDYVLKDNLVRLPTAIHRALREGKLEREGRRMQEHYRAILGKMEGPVASSQADGGMMGQVPVGVAHELNNILAPIPMAVSMLRTGLPEAERNRMLTIIESSAKRASDIVRNTLTAGRSGEGMRGPFAVDPVIREVFQRLPKTWPETLRVKLHVGEDLWQITGDAARIGQMILDLCVEAGDAMPDGGALRLSVANQRVGASGEVPLPPGVQPGAHVVVEVSDTAEGPRTEAAPHVFDPFFRTKISGETKLSAVPAVAEGRVGFILTDYVPGEGNTIKVYLPASREETRATTRAIPPVAVGEENHPAGAGRCILLADDEETIRFAAKAVLTRRGYRVLTATDGAEALRVFNAHPGEISLVLTDVMMPVMDGLALIRALRQTGSAVRIIASSGQNEKTRLAELQAAGINAVLDKPYAADILLHTVSEVMEGLPDANGIYETRAGE